MRLNGKPGHKNIKLKAGKKYRAQLKAQDKDGDSLTFLWQVKKESDAMQVGGDFEEAIANLTDLIIDPSLQNIELIAPEQRGAYRLFVYIYDGQGHAAHANIPFYVDQ
jgi:hypothetical protein